MGTELVRLDARATDGQARAMRTLLAFGDSNTHGTPPMRTLEDDGRHPREARWPGVCEAALQGWRVVEDGLPGRTTLRDDPVHGRLRNGLPALRVALAAQRPDAVALMLGTNDLKASFGLTGRDVAESLGLLLREIAASAAAPDRSAPSALLILPPLPMAIGCLWEVFDGCEARGARLGALAPGIAARHGAAFLDAGKVCAVDPLDGVHLSAASHAALGRAVAARIAAARESA